MSKLSELVESHSDDTTEFDLSQFKNPIKTKQDSILTASINADSQHTLVDLGFLPASHYLYGDNRQYFSESELKIGEVLIRINPENSAVKLQSLTLYSFKTIAPSSEIVPKYSGRFYMGYRQIYDEYLEGDGFFDLSGGIGKSKKIHKDIILYSHLDAGIATDISDTFVFAKPSVGAIINVIGDGKLIFDYELSVGQYGNTDILQSMSSEYAWFGMTDWTISIAHKRHKTKFSNRNEFQLSVNKHF